eukprot:GFUD01015216.1.p1 GENE.GFUD01015216.1~~GFUD01015216.1.p1  ORF type:complete len:279 (+),score=111.96 GFUD01015216.1:42-878(+)
MSLKRTFGLVGDYGSSESEDEETKEHAEKKSKQPLKEVTKKIDNVEGEEHANDSAAAAPAISSKWEGVRQEYEDSSFMYKYIQETEYKVPKNTTGKSDNLAKTANSKHSAEKAASDALAAADAVLNSVKELEKVGPVKTALDDPAAKAKYFKTVYEKSLKEEQEKKVREEAARDWEIKEIQKEIEDERKKWDAVWSDDEGEGAETEAVFKDQKRKVNVLQAVIDEVAKANKKPEEDVKVHTKQGERWKRLQIIAESRVNNDPEKYITYPTHKFPLRDQ